MIKNGAHQKKATKASIKPTQFGPLFSFAEKDDGADAIFGVLDAEPFVEGPEFCPVLSSKS